MAEIRRFEEDLETNGAEAHYRGNLYLVNTGQEYDEKTILPKYLEKSFWFEPPLNRLSNDCMAHAFNDAKKHPVFVMR